MRIKTTQRFVDKIVARAQNSAMGLGDPKTTYDLSQYENPSLESVALLLVNAHVDKYDLVSLMAAAMEECVAFGEEIAAAKRSLTP